jgi:hypothetical protein
VSDWWRHLWEYLGRNMLLTTLSIDGWGLSAPPLPLQSPCISTKSGVGAKGALEVRTGLIDTYMDTLPGMMDTYMDT